MTTPHPDTWSYTPPSADFDSPSDATASIERRERLLAASATASRLLLQAPDVMAAVPRVLQLVGEAADADRVVLLLRAPDSKASDPLRVASEWRPQSPRGVADLAPLPKTVSLEALSKHHPGLSAESCCGRAVLCYEAIAENAAAGDSPCGSHDTKALVPIFVGGEFAGVVGFLAHGERRAIGEAELLALETAAGVIGAALHRERLVDAVRRERERTLVSVLAERNRIAQEIHDGIAQAFTGILLQLGAFEPLAERTTGPHTELLARIEDLAREGLAEARRSVTALRPEPPQCKGLESALRELAERSTIPGGITTTLESSGWSAQFTPEHEHELLRIAQEAVSNAVRHARPQTVRISMADDKTHWALTVTDDGCGLPDDPEVSAQEGFGLTSMRERAAAIGAEWSIRSARDTGTSVVVRIPKNATP